MNLRPDWAGAIEGYLVALAAGGSPDTTIRVRLEHLSHLARRVEPGPWELSGQQLVAYAGDQEWAVETRRSRRTTFLSFWRWAIANEYAVRNPAESLPRVRASMPNPRPVPDRVYAAAVRAADARGRLMLMLAAEAGLRRAEIAQVHSRDLVEDLVGWSLVVFGKGRKYRTVPLTPRLALELRALGAGPVFPGAVDGHLSPRRVGEILAELLGGDWTAHKLRHRAATRWHQAAGGDTFVVQELLGHASPATTRRYVHVPPDSLRAAVDAAAS